jgi:hypothetical protein
MTDRIKEIKRRIDQLASKRDEASDEDDAEFMELDVQCIIRDYCVEKRYEINGFPFKLTDKNIDIEEHYELYDSSVFEAYKQYIDCLALEKEDVAELMWHYTKSFWPDEFDAMSSYLENVKGLLDSGVMYEFKL